MGWFEKAKNQVKKDMQDMDDNLTDAIGDGDYRIRTDETDIKKPKDDGKDKK